MYSNIIIQVDKTHTHTHTHSHTHAHTYSHKHTHIHTHAHAHTHHAIHKSIAYRGGVDHIYNLWGTIAHVQLIYDQEILSTCMLLID